MVVPSPRNHLVVKADLEGRSERRKRTAANHRLCDTDPLFIREFVIGRLQVLGAGPLPSAAGSEADTISSLLPFIETPKQTCNVGPWPK